MTRTVKPDTH